MMGERKANTLHSLYSHTNMHTHTHTHTQKPNKTGVAGWALIINE